jgi:hypothetical protein
VEVDPSAPPGRWRRPAQQPHDLHAIQDLVPLAQHRWIRAIQPLERVDRCGDVVFGAAFARRHQRRHQLGARFVCLIKASERGAGCALQQRTLPIG